MKRLLFILVMLTVLGLVAAQCGAAPTPETITVIETVVVKEEVEKIVTQEVEVVKEVEIVRTVEVEVIQEVEVEVAVEPPQVPEGELIVSLSTFPNSLYPPNAAERNAINAMQQMFDGLTWVDDEGNIVPNLAESWEISEDGREYIFHLRQDVVFHNGETFDAQDVVTTWQAGKDPVNAYAYDLDLATAVEVIDDYTVKISTAEPDVLFLRILNERWGIIPTDYFNEVGLEGIEDHPIGTGPFQLVEWVKGDRIVMEANPNYHIEGQPKVASLIYRPIPESATRLAAVQTGEIHIANRLSSEEAQSLLGAPNVQVVRYPVDRVYYIAFNNLTSGVGQPTEDARVRQALNYAVDRQAIIDALFDGFASLSTGYVTPGNLGYNAGLEPYPYDPDKARELLAEAGYPDGFEIGFACPIGAYTNFEQVCEAVGGYFEEVGVTMEGDEIQFMESGQYWDLEANKELPPLFADSWSTADGEALNRLTGALGGENASYSAWWTPEIQEFLDRISTAVDPEARAGVYSEFHQFLYDDPPFVYLYEPNTFEAINAAVQNYKPRAAENYYLKDVFLAIPQ
jgi:peptide/nickel transport system substrate-binding protein